MSERLTVAELRQRAEAIGFRIEKVEGEDRWLVRYAEGGAGTPGNLAHNAYQNATTALIREWLGSL